MKRCVPVVYFYNGNRLPVTDNYSPLKALPRPSQPDMRPPLSAVRPLLQEITSNQYTTSTYTNIGCHRCLCPEAGLCCSLHKFSAPSSRGHSRVRFPATSADARVSGHRAHNPRLRCTHVGMLAKHWKTSRWMKVSAIIAKL